MVAHLGETYDSATSLSKASDLTVGGHGMELSVAVAPARGALHDGPSGWSVSAHLFVDGVSEGLAHNWSEIDYQDAHTFLRSATVLSAALRAFACAEQSLSYDPS